MVESLAERQRVSIETETLVRRCQRGDKLAIGALVKRYQNYVYRLCYLVMRNEQDAEDMTQETFIRACRALPRYEIREDTSFEAWLYRIAVNCCCSRMRRKWFSSPGRTPGGRPWPSSAWGSRSGWRALACRCRSSPARISAGWHRCSPT